MDETTVIPPETIERAIEALAEALIETHRETQALALVGIANGGITLAEILAQKLEQKLEHAIPLGVANITFQRDDIGSKPIPKIASPTDLPFDMHKANIVLVDDVIFTGRTVRAAINELFDQGRPSRVELAALFDRGHRRLPIQANYVGVTQTTKPTDKVCVTLDASNPANHKIEIIPHE